MLFQSIGQLHHPCGFGFFQLDFFLQRPGLFPGQPGHAFIAAFSAQTLEQGQAAQLLGSLQTQGFCLALQRQFEQQAVIVQALDGGLLAHFVGAVAGNIGQSVPVAGEADQSQPGFTVGSAFGGAGQ